MSFDATETNVIELVLNGAPRTVFVPPGIWNLTITSTAWAGRTVSLETGHTSTNLMTLAGLAAIADDGSVQYGGKWFRPVSSGNYANLSVAFRRAS